MSYFFYVDKEKFQPLREATMDEKSWFIALAKDIQPLHENVERFNPVHDSFTSLELCLYNPPKNAHVS